MPLTHNTLITLPLNKMISDVNGLYFKRTGPRKGTWTFRYMRHGRARTMSLGPYPVLSLAEARKKLLQNRLLLSEGYDPLEERQKDQCKKFLVLDELENGMHKMVCENDILNLIRQPVSNSRYN